MKTPAHVPSVRYTGRFTGRYTRPAGADPFLSALFMALAVLTPLAALAVMVGG